MHPKFKDVFESICKQLEAEPKVQNLATPGHCRMWAKAALDFIDKIKTNLSAQIVAEAREAHVHQGLSHTFIRIEIRIGEFAESYLIDGTGVLDEPPYFGLESSAPLHFGNSRPDPMNLYRKQRNKEEGMIARIIREAFSGKTVQEALGFLLKVDREEIIETDLPTGEIRSLFEITPDTNRVISPRASEIRVALFEFILLERGDDLKYLTMPRPERRFPEEDVTD
ncbi:MAG: hypothetical protein US96_C0032G0006 [Candidatus Woesebacteria bacterium GW2011_GWB1_38_5b]|uniref:Uncharacterized protein n=1 Tax=Candidatus Woesebacteria bacterium GW2011_GWB1_38_5b TaxID=1618569 RepID=A0A0G0K6H0_9BACT|nr:MAG: hypothetical protein US96_C0032G0006 [Candidatus Woesebacteria bacterium GW2011_GWB1_38_5b]